MQSQRALRSPPRVPARAVAARPACSPGHDRHHRHSRRCLYSEDHGPRLFPPPPRARLACTDRNANVSPEKISEACKATYRCGSAASRRYHAWRRPALTTYVSVTGILNYLLYRLFFYGSVCLNLCFTNLSTGTRVALGNRASVLGFRVNSTSL